MNKLFIIVVLYASFTAAMDSWVVCGDDLSSISDSFGNTMFDAGYYRANASSYHSTGKSYGWYSLD